MLQTRLLALAASSVLAAAASAQQFCSDNLWPVHIVDAQGNELPVEFDATVGENVFVVPTETVYLAFDPALASGTYYVHVTDTPIDGLDEVVSTNDPMDRFVAVQNDNGVISLSLPFSANPQNAVFGVGLNGVGQSLRLNPFSASQYSQCRFKAWYGDVWDLSNGPQNPYLLAGGVHPTTGLCAVRSYHSFRIGDGTGSDVGGVVFEDANRNGLRDAGEAGVAGAEVVLIGAGGSVPATTGSDGAYVFEDVDAGEYTVELSVPTGSVATTASSFAVTVCDCAPVTVGDFGLDTEVLPCDAKPLCYWWSWQGVCEAEQAGILPTLPMLCIVNTFGHYVSPCSKWHLKWYLRFQNAWNMAYSLSAQLVAMHANVLTGRVSAACVIDDPCLGVMTVAELMQQSVASLCAHRYTPPCSGPARHQQARLRNALWRANNNQIWR